MTHISLADPAVNRRRFLERIALVSGAIPILGVAACGGPPAGGGTRPDGGEPTREDAGTERDAGVPQDAGAPQDAGDVCRATRSDIEGPFYRTGAPFQVRIAEASERGERLFITGTVYLPDCRTPIADAIVDVWQASDAGRYDNDDPNNPPAPTSYRLRGRMRTNTQGRYAYETILPGAYRISQTTFRPRHIHYKVFAQGRADFTTQLYFAGDPFLSGDPWADASRAIALTRDAAGAHGTFDLVLP